MKKLLLLLCSIGANAAFADKVPVSCSVQGESDSGVVNVEIATLTGKVLSKTVSADNYFVRFLSFTGSYDEYLDKCMDETKSTQKILGLKFGYDGLTKYIPVNEKYHTSYDLLKDNPNLAAFARVKAFGTLVASEDLDPISQNQNLSVKLGWKNRTPLGAGYNPEFTNKGNLSDALTSDRQKLIFSKLDTLTPYIPGGSTKDAEAVGLFLSRYLHDRNGLLDNLPFSYGLTKNKTDHAVSAVEIDVKKNKDDTIFLVVRLYLEPTRFINPQNNPNHLMAVLSMPLVLHTGHYKYGDKKQQLTINVSKTGPIVRFYNAKTKKPENDKRSTEYMGLMALGMTNLNIDQNAPTNSDKFTLADLIKEVGGSDK